MQTFLHKVAQKLLADYSEQGLKNLTLVFPGRRAAIFFADALASMIERPVWLPEQVSIDDLIRKITKLETPHTLILIRILWEIYNRHLPEAREKNFDDFYEWGTLLLADFDTIDKYRIDADRLYTNIDDLEAIDERFADDDDAQRMIVEFWRSLKNRGTRGLEREFLGNWGAMRMIYNEFKVALVEKNLGYPGMIYREAADLVEVKPTLLTEGDDVAKKYVFIGFNALNPCEQAILSVLTDNKRALFFWDADSYYLSSRTQEAGHFLRRNIRKFGVGELPVEDNFLKQKQIRVVSTPSDVMQCKMLGKLLEEVDPTRRTAVILTDETLLPIALRSIPHDLRDVNITMGTPLNQSAAYVVFDLLRTMHANRTDAGYYFRDVMNLLAHPLVATSIPAADLARLRSTEVIYFDDKEFKPEKTDELTRKIFPDYPLNPSKAADYYISLLEKMVVKTVTADDWEMIENNEFCYSLIVELRNMDRLVRDDGQRISMKMYNRLLTKMCRTAKVPIVGKPLQGLQIMGILESRCLDFDDIFILSLSDANFPGNKPPQSYIPPTLRKAYGLPTAEDHGAMWAYYFYRLLQRAGRVTLLHSSATTDFAAAEPSRYLYQLLYESPHKIERFNVSLQPAPASEKEPRAIDKTPEIVSKLNAVTITPWAVNSYVDCPLKFYYEVVERIAQSRSVDDPLGASDLGSVFHDAAQTIYGKYASPEALKLLKPTEIEASVNKIVASRFGVRLANGADVASIEHLKQLTVKYLNVVIDYDISTSGLASVQKTERWVDKPLIINGIERKIGGKIDREDLTTDGEVRIVDYKTGKGLGRDLSVAGLFDASLGTKRNSVFLQMLIYTHLTGYTHSVIYSLPELCDGKNPETIDLTEYLPEFMEGLNSLLLQIYDPATPFSATQYAENCKYCQFRQMCQR